MSQIYGLRVEHLDFQQRAAAAASGELASHAADVDATGRFPNEGVNAVARAGLFGLCVAPEFGGAGQSPRVFAAVVEELAQACSSTAMIFTHARLGGADDRRLDDICQKEEVLFVRCRWQASDDAGAFGERIAIAVLGARLYHGG